MSQDWIASRVTTLPSTAQSLEALLGAKVIRDAAILKRKPASVATSKISFTDLWLEPAVAYRSTQATFKPSELPHDGLWTHWFPFVRNSMHPTPLGFACLETDYKL